MKTRDFICQDGITIEAIEFAKRRFEHTTGKPATFIVVHPCAELPAHEFGLEVRHDERGIVPNARYIKIGSEDG